MSTNMAAISLFQSTNTADMRSCENYELHKHGYNDCKLNTTSGLAVVYGCMCREKVIRNIK